MYSVGPFNVNPFLSRYPNSPVPLQVGRNGLVEVINLTAFDIFVSLPVLGTIFQESRSKVVYRASEATQGAQLLSVQRTASGTFANIPNRVVRVPYVGQNGEIGFLGIYVNVYEEGEIEWYPPVALSPPASQTCFYESTFSTTNLSFSLPTTASFFGAPANEAYCNLLGFDFSGNAPSANISTALAITNLNNQPGGSTQLLYKVAANTGQQVPHYEVRFSTPIPNFSGQAITFSVSGATGVDMVLNAYYSLT